MLYPLPGVDTAWLLSALPDIYPDLVEFEGVEILGAEVRPGKDCGWTRVSGETAVPTRIEATLYTADPLLKVGLRIHVDWAGRGIVREITVLTDGPQTGVSINLLRRIQVDKLMRFAMNQASVPVTLRPDIQEGAFQLKGEEDAPFAWVSGGPVQPGRGKNTPADRIVRVAEIYKDAVANGSRSPVDVVISVMGYSSATASRDLKEARKRGLLPPAGAKGGRTPVPSVIAGTGRISRMSAEEFSKQAVELGLQGSGPKGKRLADMTPEEFEQLAIRLGAYTQEEADARNAHVEEMRRADEEMRAAKHPGINGGE